jgi:hypothetical protein
MARDGDATRGVWIVGAADDNDDPASAASGCRSARRAGSAADVRAAGDR